MKNKLHLKISVITMVIMGSLLNLPFGYAVADANATANANDDTSVCYAAPTVAFMLDVKRHSVIINSAQAARFGQPVQTVYSVHGKYVETAVGNEVVSPLVGTIIVGSRTGNSNTSGAKLGLTVYSLRGENGQQTHFQQTLNCTSDEATPTPKLWTNCFISDEAGHFTENSTVTRSDDLQHRGCTFFK
jgi:hypothetical protein